MTKIKSNILPQDKHIKMEDIQDISQYIERVNEYIKAQADIVHYIMEKYDVTEEQLKSCSGWLTSQREKGETKDKYFRNVKRFDVDEKDYWVGTSSNLETKCNQAKTLCEIARVGKNEIFWYVKSSEFPVFSWLVRKILPKKWHNPCRIREKCHFVFYKC